MDEVSNISKEEVLELIENFPIQPLRGKVVISVNIEEMEEEGLDFSGVAFSPVQYVLAVGSFADSVVEPGNTVHLDLDSLMAKVSDPENVYESVASINIKPINVGDRMFGLVDVNNIEYIIKE